MPRLGKLRRPTSWPPKSAKPCHVTLTACRLEDIPMRRLRRLRFEPLVCATAALFAIASGAAPALAADAAATAAKKGDSDKPPEPVVVPLETRDGLQMELTYYGS